MLSDEVDVHNAAGLYHIGWWKLVQGGMTAEAVLGVLLMQEIRDDEGEAEGRCSGDVRLLAY